MRSKGWLTNGRQKRGTFVCEPESLPAKTSAAKRSRVQEKAWGGLPELPRGALAGYSPERRLHDSYGCTVSPSAWGARETLLLDSGGGRGG